MLQAIGILPVTPIGGASARIHIGEVPRFWAKHSQEGGRIHGAGAFFYIKGLLNDASLVGPKVL